MNHKLVVKRYESYGSRLESFANKVRIFSLTLAHFHHFQLKTQAAWPGPRSMRPEVEEVNRRLPYEKKHKKTMKILGDFFHF